MSIVAAIFAHDPASTAVSISGETLSYRRLQEDVDVCTAWLHEQGVGRGTRLGIWPRHDHSYWGWVAHLAAIRLGACHATVGAGSGTLRAALRIGLDLCLTFNEGLEKVAPRLRRLVLQPQGLAPLSDQLGIEPKPWTDPEAEQSASRIAFTSGTTGSPRGLLWTYERIMHRVDQASRNARIWPSTRLYVALGLLTTAGFRYPVATWQAGGCVLRPGSPEEVAEPTREIVLDSNLVVASPVNLRGHLNHIQGPWRGKSERVILVLGGRLPADTRDEALARACARVEVNYGSTETGTVASADASVLDRHAGAVGYLGDGVTVEIVDEEGKAVPPGEAGVLRIRTEGMCSGYEAHAGPADPSLGFHDGWFYPGDMAIRFEDGLLAIAGRTSEVVNIAGIKLSTGDLEGRIGRNPSVREVCVLPISLRQRDVLAVVAALANDVDLSSLRQEIRRALPLNCPHYLVRAGELPRNAMGKVQRRQLVEQVTAVLQRKVENEGVGEHRADRDQ